jgi:hypothetical protein
MVKLNRYSFLVEAGYVNNRMTLQRRVNAGTFPPPYDLGENTRVWTDTDLEEVDRRIREGIADPNPEWLARLTERKARKAARKTSTAACAMHKSKRSAVGSAV